MRIPLVSFALAAAWLTLVAPAAARPYASAGPHAVNVSPLSSDAQVVRPEGAGKFPLIVASHGWSASGQNQIGWAKQFASWGFVVAVPSFPSPLSPDAETDANVITSLVDTLSKDAGVDAQKIGLEGHSAGGLATTVAAQKLGAAVSAVVLFDPVDKDAIGAVAYATLCAPILGLFAAPSSCNGQAGWRPFATSARGEVIAFDVVGSTHCDGENQDRGMLCGLACGGAASAERQAVYAGYATAFFLARLAGDGQAAAALSDSSVAADTAVSHPLHTTSTCVASSVPPAATTPATPMGTTPPVTSPSGSDSDSSRGGAPAAEDDAGSSGGCRESPRGGGTTAGFAAAACIGLAIRAWRRRPRTRTGR